MSEIKTTEWCGYNWKSAMDGGRIIHPSYPWYWYSMDTTFIDSNGDMHLFIRYNPKDIKHWDGEIYHPTYEVGTLRSLEAFDYGTFYASIKMPKGAYISSSFWLSGQGNWPPEIDIEEGWPEGYDTYYRKREQYFPWFVKGWRTTNNVHYNNDKIVHEHIGSRNVPVRKQPNDPAENFVEYKCVWEPDRIRFYADGRLTRTVKKSVCRKLTTNLKNPEKGYKMNMIFNVWCENPDEFSVRQDTDMVVRDFRYEPLK